MEQRVQGQTSAGRMSAWVLDMKRLSENAPRRADLILDKLAGDQLTLRLTADTEVIAGFNRAAGRLSWSLLASSLILVCGYALGIRMQQGADAARRNGTSGAVWRR